MPKKNEPKLVTKNVKYNNSPVIGKEAGEMFLDESEKKAFASKTINEMMEYFNAPKVKTDEEFIERTEQYFYRCAKKGIRPTWEEFALSLGTTRATLWDWETGRYPKISAELVKMAKEFLSTYDARAVSEGKLNPVAYIFRSKNYYGLKDQQEHILTPNTGDIVDKNKLIEEAEMLPDL